MYAAPGIGLAATQVDVHERIIAVDVSDNADAPHILVNPQFTVHGALLETEEGCLSVPGFYEPVSRAERISVTAQTPTGEVFSMEAEGLLAVCIQHECDHLAGKLFVDYISNLKRNRIRKKLERQQKQPPIERAIMAGDEQTGVCIMAMEAGLDTGPVFAQVEVPIGATATATQLTEKLADTGGELLIEVLTTIATSKAEKRKLPAPRAQDETLATYAHKLEASDRNIDWSESAKSIADKIRGLAGRMPVRGMLGDAHVQILEARPIEQHLPGVEATPAGTLVDVSKSGIIVQCATDLLQITRIKVERGKGTELDPAAAINGYSELFFPGARFAN
ncbi:def [Symbiodinium necroappetens]|uniref:Peptide deformylase n=1 Tax=Symbiodinium necroappetens TaxID=1628268 RepID=A0A812UHI2_9DINO|nr:def [Symbiodinium necroappetens]